MSYTKHFAFYHAGDYRESYICVCPRRGSHMVKRLDIDEMPTLFELNHEGEMVLEPESQRA